MLLQGHMEPSGRCTEMEGDSEESFAQLPDGRKGKNVGGRVEPGCTGRSKTVEFADECRNFITAVGDGANGT